MQKSSRINRRDFSMSRADDIAFRSAVIFSATYRKGRIARFLWHPGRNLGVNLAGRDTSIARRNPRLDRRGRNNLR